MSESQSTGRDGKVVTFYSYKGGTGRTMALANVAWILAANGKRVLVVDWDLESPGLPRFFSPFLRSERLETADGVIQMVQEYEWSASRETRRDPAWLNFYTNVRQKAIPLEWPEFPPGGCLDLLIAGRQNHDYSVAVNSIDWDDFYERLSGGLFFEALRQHMKRDYDYTLIDSRTGLSDVADICTMLLPDILVDCFTFSEQGITGASRVARAVADYDRRDIRILPVPMRVDPAEKLKADAGRHVAKQRFAKLPAELDAADRDRYWAVTQVPYQAFYAYEEVLATFGDLPGAPNSLLAAYETIAAHITDGEIAAFPAMAEQVRLRVLDRFERKLVPTEDAVALRYMPEDQVWAEWIESVLQSSGVVVHSVPINGSPSSDEQPGRELVVVSKKYAESQGRVTYPAGAEPPLAVFVNDVPAVPRPSAPTSVEIAGLREDGTIEQLLRLVGRADAMAVVQAARHPRFPGSEPSVFNVPGRNRRFTGREEELRLLRDRLLRGGAAVISGETQVVALQGMGGIGKTQIAMEYAHRFRAAYDVVWWISADQVAFIDTQLGDLGAAMALPLTANAAENLRVVRQALRTGRPYGRWLLIFDNAEDAARVAEFLPQGAGHVIVTSRGSAWADRATATQNVDVFQRRESVAHLMNRVPSMTGDVAGQIASRLGDLPIAVAAAGALLSETGRGAEDYLREIDRSPDNIGSAPGALRRDQSEDPNFAVAATWDASLDRLKQRSPAAFRLLQLFSVMASEISLELVYSKQLAQSLKFVDRSVSEGQVTVRLIQQINRLALLKIDQIAPTPEAGQVIVHRVLQDVVRSRMTAAQLDDVREQVQMILAAARPDQDVDDAQAQLRYRRIWPHIEVCGAVHSTMEDVRRLLIDRVRYLYLVGDTLRGIEEAEQIEAVWVSALADLNRAVLTDPEAVVARDILHQQLLHLRFNKANILLELGRFEESRLINEEVLAEQQELVGEAHPHTLMTAGGLAAALRGLGKYGQALELDERTYTAWVDNYGETNLRTLMALNNLATSYRLMGEFAEALSRDETVYRTRIGLLGETALLTLWSAGLIGRDHREAGEYERSEAELRKIADSYAQTYGPDARWTLNARANWAVSLRSLGRSPEAVALLDDAFEKLSADHPTSPDTLACRLSLSATYLSRAELRRAEKNNEAADADLRRAQTELEEVGKLYRDSLGEEHPYTLVCKNNLSMVLRAKQEFEAAQETAEYAAVHLDRVLGPTHPYTLAARTNLSVCLAEGGDLERGLAVIEDALALIGPSLGDDHPDTLRCRANHALILLRMGREEAAAAEESAMKQLAGRIGKNHPAVRALHERRYLHRIIDPQPF